MRMKKVTKEELAAMDADSDRCAAELADARVDVLGYACLVAIMSMGKGYHWQSQARLQRGDGAGERQPAPGRDQRRRARRQPEDDQARKIAMVAPYVKALTCMVADYIEAEGIEVADRDRARNPRQPRGGASRSAGPASTSTGS